MRVPQPLFSFLFFLGLFQGPEWDQHHPNPDQSDQDLQQRGQGWPNLLRVISTQKNAASYQRHNGAAPVSEKESENPLEQFLEHYMFSYARICTGHLGDSSFCNKESPKHPFNFYSVFVLLDSSAQVLTCGTERVKLETLGSFYSGVILHHLRNHGRWIVYDSSERARPSEDNVVGHPTSFLSDTEVPFTTRTTPWPVPARAGWPTRGRASERQPSTTTRPWRCRSRDG